MDIQILPKARMSDSGSTLIKSMQNQSMNLLDVLVRESIQNSLDAADYSKEYHSVKVDFTTGEFDSVGFSDELAYISDSLRQRYPAEKYNFIAISDRNTTGLTGIDDFSNDRTRLQSLVYQIGKGQTQEGSGGSWGYGKTTFFRIGMGIVVYYSRTCENGIYRNLLVASFVEDETSNPIITEPDSRGIAFFGVSDSNSDEDPIRRMSLPVTDDEQIRQILDYFGLKMYGDNDTGTTIIMPYVDYDELIGQLFPDNVKKSDYPSWGKSISEVFKIIIQRWYAPRLYSYEFNGRWLEARVNGETIRPDQMNHFFRLVNKLYEIANKEGNKEARYIIPVDWKKSIKSQLVKVRDIKGQTCGCVAAAYFDRDLLKITDKPGHDIYTLIGRHDPGINTSIVTYTRKPGMLVSYEIGGDWAPVMQLDDDRILVSVFVLKSDAELKEVPGKKYFKQKLEEYVRQCEKSAHDSWYDPAGFTILEKLKKNASSAIVKMFTDKSKKQLEKRSDLCGLFSEMFLPPTLSYSNGSSAGNVSGGGVGGGVNTHSRKKNKFSIVSNELVGLDRVLTIDMHGVSDSEPTSIRFVLESERGSVEPDEWESISNKEFPLFIDSICIVCVTSDSENSDSNDVSPDECGFALNGWYSGRLLKTEKTGITYGFVISVESNRDIRITVSAKCASSTFSFELKHKQEAA